ncbi:MAG: DNA mismatch repair protein [Bacteroidetes bacterium]|nr:DNA mismatch repair protein [Bacteroidota bacterium]
MNFITDQQTMNDLNLLGKHRRGSIFSLFCKVHTTGGERLLEQMFRHPLTDAEAINKRSGVFRHFAAQGLVFPLSGEQVDAMEAYLESPGHGHLPAAVWHGVRRKALASLVRNEEFEQLREGLLAAVYGLRVLGEFLRELGSRDPVGPYASRISAALEVLGDKRLVGMLEGGMEGWGLWTLVRHDYLLRTSLRKGLETVRAVLSELDVYICVGNLAKVNNWGYAGALAQTDSIVWIDELRHPAVSGAVGNSIVLDKKTNMLFLTGANMAGKSTFMKAFGVAVYLAHMGFPVAAAGMAFSVRDGLFSSINVADDLSQGHSHFYAEVLRVKSVAQAVSEGKRLVVLFDELFKGTNVKDAYDGTLAVTEAFSKYGRCAFIISTHIVEAGEVLRQHRYNLRFAYLPTVLEEGRPRYTYILQEGIAADRVGMTIIENEKIIDIITQHS